MQLAHEIADRIACRGQEQMSVEDIQNCVEIELMKSRRKDVAQLYIAYRNQRSVARKAKTRDIFLEIIEQVPNLALLEASGFVWQFIFRDVF